MNLHTAEQRTVGIDLGAETLKIVELIREGDALRWTRRKILDHGKNPGGRLLEVLEGWGWGGVKGAAVSGRLGRQLALRRIPTKQAQAAGYRFLYGSDPATVVSIGSHGFSVLELRGNGLELFRENSRCSQGTGNFLRQLVERFGLTIEEAARLCVDVVEAAPLSGRCPVILKTDMTHLANKGEDRARILAGLFDAVCENVQVLIKPRLSPPRVALIGGVSRSLRVREHFRRFLARHEMVLAPPPEAPEEACFLEALGSAAIAAEGPSWVPPLDQILARAPESRLETVPPLKDALSRVRRMERVVPDPEGGSGRPIVFGFDIGSTGSKAVALDVETRALVWEGYVRTSGDPVGAARTLFAGFVESASGTRPLVAVGVTGSGREIVGSLLATCYGPAPVFVLNEIAAHAEGAVHFDPRVDTIFEIGGQDAKYIRLAEGRVVDAAMNEACSAGTGSFIEEQGGKFAGVRDVAHLGEEALAADCGVSLGQHCSVFMAEVIDGAVATGVATRSIIAGIYDSIVQNYLNRVKGARSVGQVIFCQGMPFSSDALAAAVARQTGARVVVPPNPGTIGAFGIALLTLKDLAREGGLAERPPLEARRFLEARVEKKDVFVCKSARGCGGAGNKCRIDRLTTLVAGGRRRFTWGGGCSLYDQGTRKAKLPERAPDPFQEREGLVGEIVDRVTARRGGPTVAVTDEFLLKGLFPFFATFLHGLGFDLEVHGGADRGVLKRGIEEANVPFCAPMQQYQGLASAMAEGRADRIFLPMLRSLPRVADEPHAVVCPIVQGSPDLLRWNLGKGGDPSRIVSPVVDLGAGGLESEEFRASCRRIAAALGVAEGGWRGPYHRALAEQFRFDARCLELGRSALAFASERGILPIVVLGRTYTIYNKVLNSNVPALLREQGAMAVPVDCYKAAADVPVFRDVFWGYSQRNLRAAHQIRRTPGLYGVFCSNYSCGPDSFTAHFYAYIMEGKPYALIETDGHSGDAGTKTRIEAFLHCVREDLRDRGGRGAVRSLSAIEADKTSLTAIRERRDRVLIPRMGPGAGALAACLRGRGIPAESLPMPDRESVRLGRRYTSGKECVPMCITLGSLLQRIERDRSTEERFAFLMATACGPCRFGVYNLLHKIVLERLDWKDRVRVWSPGSDDYFEGVPPGFAVLAFAALAASDALLEALYDARPVERTRGAAEAVYRRFAAELETLMEREAKGDLPMPAALMQVAGGRLFGVMDLLRRAAAAFRSVKTRREVPTVLVVGEIYVRLDPFANDFVVDRLEERGIRCRLAPFNEWIEYTDHLNRAEGTQTGFTAQMNSVVRATIQRMTYRSMAGDLGWAPRTTVKASLKAAAPYLREDLQGEAVLTLGGPLHEWRRGRIDGMISVGPLECMPNKIAEAQLFHAAEREGLLSVTVPLNGDPLDPEVLDNFAFEVHARFRKRTQRGAGAVSWMDRSRRMIVGIGRIGTARREPSRGRAG